MNKKQEHEAAIERTKLSGEVVERINFFHELGAQHRFDEMISRKPAVGSRYSEYPEGRCGSLRLVVKPDAERYVRRELYIHP